MLRRRILTIAAATITTVALTLPASAQPGRGGGGGMGGGMMGGMQRAMEPSISSRDAQAYADMLGLDAEQRETMQMLYEAYQQGFADAARTVRQARDEIREEFRETRDPAVWGRMRTIMQDMMTQARTVESQFLDDMQFLLTDSQAEVWPRVERTHRRRTTIWRGVMSGERVDLVRAVEELRLPDDHVKGITPIIEQYEIDLDRVLAERNRLHEEAQNRVAEAFMEQRLDDIGDVWERARRASVAVRDVNRRYARTLETMLPEDFRETFVANFKRESFPMIYRETFTDRIVNAASGFEDLSEDQRGAIEGIKLTYQRQVAAINLEMERAFEEREMNITPESMMRQGFDSGPMRELRERQRELETQTAERVRALLNEEQVARLPERRGGDGTRPGAGQGPRGGERQAPAPETRRRRAPEQRDGSTSMLPAPARFFA